MTYDLKADACPPMVPGRIRVYLDGYADRDRWQYTLMKEIEHVDREVDICFMSSYTGVSGEKLIQRFKRTAHVIVYKADPDIPSFTAGHTMLTIGYDMAMDMVRGSMMVFTGDRHIFGMLHDMMAGCGLDPVSGLLFDTDTHDMTVEALNRICGIHKGPEPGRDFMPFGVAY